MSEPSSQEPKDQSESNPLDLSDLQSFSFGTQWTDAGQKSKGGRRDGSDREAGRSRRPRRRPGGEAGRDRRPARRPISQDRGPRGGDERRPRRPQNEGGDRRTPDRGNWRRGNAPERPYESPVFEVGFYPDDVGFSTIIKALRANHITYELFEVAKIFLEKSDRFVASVTRKAAPGEKPERVFVSIPDGMPFETEEEAIQHAINHNIDTLFDTEEVEVEAPTGNFQFVNRCGITKALLGPPNYHRYEELVTQHHQSQLSHMPFERFQQKIEQVREEETVNEWLESMKKAKRYTSKAGEGEETQTFDSLNDAIGFLRTTQRDKLVKSVSYARVSGVTLDKFPNAESSRAVAGELARQRRFPLNTANAIRGRLRREKFSIYKKGSKGVTLICSTKRRFRTEGQVMADSLDRLICFLEANQNIKTKELPPAFEVWLKEAHPDVAFDEKKLFQDLHWLIADGYVSHFGDDTLFAQPVLDNAPKSKAASPKPKSETAKAVDEASREAQTSESAPNAANDIKEPETPAQAEGEAVTPAESSEESPIAEPESKAEPATVKASSEAETSPEIESEQPAPEPEVSSTEDSTSSEGSESESEASAEQEAGAEEIVKPKAPESADKSTSEAESEEDVASSESADESDPEPEEAKV